ncbi:hypothetical protein BH23GEM2_BH23GEM2_20530 [soil metagenome]
MRSLRPAANVSGRDRAALQSLATAVLAVIVVGCATDAPSPTEPSSTSVADATAEQPIVVGSAAELVAALSPANAGRRIHVRTGSYAVTQPLTVPDGVTLEGEGVMLFDGGLPTGFAAGTRTALTMTANVPGNVLTLGNGVTVRRLAIEDLAGRSGNAVGVVSRDAGDDVSATISETEILNPTAHGQAPAGPTGCGLVVITHNPNGGMDPPPHEGAAVKVRVSRSLIRAPSAGTGCGLFAFNFASLGSVFVTLEGNVVGGGIVANGGVSRPDAVRDARVTVQSRRNLYRDDSPNPCASRHLGWNLTGGSGSLLPFPPTATVGNSLRVHSIDDRIEGFTTGILARGGLRIAANTGLSSENSIDIELLGTTLSTPSCGGAPASTDFRMAAAQVLDASLLPGDGNTVRAVIRGVTGSGARFNVFTGVLGPAGPQPVALRGSGNRLEIVGSPQAFARTNSSIDPAPSAEFFSSAGK